MTNSSRPKRIALNTGGGDAPGLNAVIRAVVLGACNKGWEVYGIPNGYLGLLETDKLFLMDRDKVRGITHLGGTILGTTNRGNPFDYPIRRPDGSVITQDLSDRVVDNFRRLRLDCLITVGGDGTLNIAYEFFKKGIPVIGVPKTIDNDLGATVMTFGFDTAVTTATEAIDKLHSTAESHQRVMVVEVMGRHAGWIALNAGISGTADVILIPEIPFDIEKVCDKIMDRELHGRHFSIVVVAEGASPVGGQIVTRGEKTPGQEVRLGGIADQVAFQIQEKTGKETRALTLGHLQRGGSPTTFDRLLGLRFGAAAIRAAERGESGVMMALVPPEIRSIPLEDAIQFRKQVPIDSDTVQTARMLGICLGD